MKSNSCFFSPASTFWRVNRELLIYLAGGRALLLEIAHPLVAAGVAQHSGFRQHPLRRLWRTMQVMTQLTFGNEEERQRAVRAFHECHRHVHGRLAKGAGGYEAGCFYHAADPELKLWVLATLIDSALLAYEVFVAPLSWEEKQFYYEDSGAIALSLGIPAQQWPEDFLAFTLYMSEMVGGNVLHVGENARQIVAALMQTLWLRPVTRAARFLGTGLLPENVRAMYQMHWNEKDEARLQRLAAHVRRLRLHLPGCVCVSPKALPAERRHRKMRVR